MQVDDVSGNTDFTDTPTTPLFNKQHTVYDHGTVILTLHLILLTQRTHHHLNPVVGDTVKDTVTGATAVVPHKRQSQHCKNLC